MFGWVSPRLGFPTGSNNNSAQMGTMWGCSMTEPNQTSSRPSRLMNSPAKIVGIGCAVVLLPILLGAAWMLYRGLHTVGTQLQALTDPTLRQARVLEVLRTRQLPPGWHADMAISVDEPMVIRMASLIDLSPEDTSGKKAQQGLMWFEVQADPEDRDELRAFLAGQDRSLDLLKRWGADGAIRQQVSRGTLQVNDRPVQYSSWLGDVKLKGPGDISPRVEPGYSVLFMATCEGSPLMHFGLVFSQVTQEVELVQRGIQQKMNNTDINTESLKDSTVSPAPTPTSDTPRPAALSISHPGPFAGTLVDPGELQALLAHFKLCP